MRSLELSRARLSTTSEKNIFLYIYLVFCILVRFSQADERLNVILIMADDSAADNYGCYGSKFFSTPRLDALAQTGAKFNHCYSEPVCTSSRVKIMTGRDGIRNYVQFGTLDKDEITFAHIMKDAGYANSQLLENGNYIMVTGALQHQNLDSIIIVCGIIRDGGNYTFSILAPQFGEGWKNNGNNKRGLRSGYSH